MAILSSFEQFLVGFWVFFDKMSEDVTCKLKKEFVEDVTKAGHYTIHLMSDHGTSNDILKTKKNVLILARTTDKMEIKTFDTFMY